MAALTAGGRKPDRAPGRMARPVRSEGPATRSARERKERDSVRTKP